MGLTVNNLRPLRTGLNILQSTIYKHPSYNKMFTLHYKITIPDLCWHSRTGREPRLCHKTSNTGNLWQTRCNDQGL